MIKFLKHKLAAHSLASKQKAAAAELQAIFNTREELLAREQFLMRYSAGLAVREVEHAITARRNARQQVQA
jgi:hypothetical protein